MTWSICPIFTGTVTFHDGMNSFANGTNSFANGTKSIAKRKNSIVKICKTAFYRCIAKVRSFFKIMIFSQLTVFLLRFVATAEKRTEILTYIEYVQSR